MKPALIVPLLAALCLAKDRSEQKDATVFLGPLGRAEAAPSVEGAAMRVVLTNVGDDPAWKGVFEALAARSYDRVVSFKGSDVAPAFRELKALRPGFVAVVLPHDTLDVNWHFEFLERAAQLDDDPFVDFAFGYVTGATPAEAVAFVQAIDKADRGRLPRSILEFGPVERPYGPTSPAPHKFARDWKTRGLWHALDASDVAARLAELDGVGIYRAGGHGMPDGVDHGLSGRALRESRLRIFPALYFSGPCYCGVTGRWFSYAHGQVKEERVEPMDSFLLSLIHAGATGVFAGLDPDRGETNNHELEHLLMSGDPLGMASKSTYDDVVVAYRRDRLTLPRHRPGKGWPFRDIHDQMISGAACRALFGDPAYAPVKRAADDPFRATLRRTKKGLEVTWSGDGTIGNYWAPVDVLRAEGGWTHRIRLCVELPLDEARGLKGFKVLAVTKDGEDLPYTYATAAVEAWADRGRVHLLVVFPRSGKDRALWGGKEYEARFLLRGRR